MAPCYIAFEGAEGCGKSTQAARLAAELGAVLTRETGGTTIGERIRAVLHDPDNTHLDAVAEALLIAGDRAQHRAEVVAPALSSGRDVVSDRSVWSSIAYQGYGRGLPLAAVRQVNDWALGGRWPDLVVLLEISPETAAARLAPRALDRFEREDGEFFGRVAEGFRALAAADPERWVVLDGEADADEVHRAVREAVQERLGR